MKTQDILQRRSKKGQSACRSAAHLSNECLARPWTLALLRVVHSIRIIFDELRASVTSPVWAICGVASFPHPSRVRDARTRKSLKNLSCVDSCLDTKSQLADQNLSQNYRLLSMRYKG